MFLQLDGTFWVQAINFAIFYAILRVVFVRPVGEAIRKRREYIDGVQRDYDRYVQEARRLRGEADAKRAAARRDAEERVTRARVAADEQAQVIAAEFGAKAAAIAAQARKTVDAEMVSARAREPELAGRLAETLLERAMGALSP